MAFCVGSSAAKRRYQRDSLRWMAVYLVVLAGSALMVRHEALRGWELYFWSVLPSIPVLGVVWRMGRYLREETDEYLRLLTMQAILVGAGLLVAVLMVSDFLRGFANMGALPPFVDFIIFCGGMAATQAWQSLQNRPTDA